MMRATRAVVFIVLASVLLSLSPSVADVAEAKVVGENPDELPPGCDEVAGDVSFDVRGGREHAANFSGAMWTFTERSWTLDPCTRVTVTFTNDDPIRHQWMVHGTFPEGFTLIELDGQGTETATFILPAQDATLLIHCGVSQHQQKGMKGQILVGEGQGDLPNILGISGVPDGEGEQDAQVEQPQGIPVAGALVPMILLGAAAVLRRKGE